MVMSANNFLKIGFLGPRGTYSEQALASYLQGAVVDSVQLPSIDQVLQEVTAGTIDAGIVPVENSLEGAVNVTLDILANSVHLKIIAEVILPIEHWLLLPTGVQLQDVTKVYSHNQALGQCREALTLLLPQAEHCPCASTALAAQKAAQSGEPWAAIGSKQLATTYGLEAHSALKCGQNYTRFLVIGREDTKPTGLDKTSLVFTLNDRPGGLSEALQIFAQRGINLTKIESRPTKQALGKYLFYLDLDGHQLDSITAEALRELGEIATFVRIMGSYPKAQVNQVASPQWEIPDLGVLRKQIDYIDQEIVQLLANRVRLVDQVGLTKNCQHAVRDAQREEQILNRLRKIAANQGVDPELISEIYQSIIAFSVQQQLQRREHEELP